MRAHFGACVFICFGSILGRMMMGKGGGETSVNVMGNKTKRSDVKGKF
jgi:hypothetical protein